jgi:hypothetical protein
MSCITTGLTKAGQRRVCEEVLGERTLLLSTSLLKDALHWHPDYEHCKSATLAPNFTHYSDFGLIVEAMRRRGFEIDAKYYQKTQRWQVTFFHLHRRHAAFWRKEHPNLATAAAVAALNAVQDMKRGEVK